jgi:hypothetical protein
MITVTVSRARSVVEIPFMESRRITILSSSSAKDQPYEHKESEFFRPHIGQPP